MSTIYVYNTKQQALNSKKIAELFSFASNDFAGLVSNTASPIAVDTNNKTWSWNISGVASFIGGGVDIEYDVEDKEFQFAQECSIWGLEIGIPSSNSSIISNKYNRAIISEIPCSSITTDNIYIIVNYPSGNPSEKTYYEFTENGYVPSTDNTVVTGKEYYYRLENEAFKVTGALFDGPESHPMSFDYYGNTIWITADRFFIPFCGLCNGEVIPMLFNRDKTGYESFLTARTYYHLLTELGNQFVWRIGGETLGDIGDLNITDNIIKNKTNTENGVSIDRPTITNLGFSNNVEDLLRINENGKVYKVADQYIIPIKHGGTRADNEDNARKNLGFTYGTTDPTDEPTKREDGSTDIGAVYFKLL